MGFELKRDEYPAQAVLSEKRQWKVIVILGSKWSGVDIVEVPTPESAGCRTSYVLDLFFTPNQSSELLCKGNGSFRSWSNVRSLSAMVEDY